jgi:hypothetical protein
MTCVRPGACLQIPTPCHALQQCIPLDSGTTVSLLVGRGRLEPAPMLMSNVMPGMVSGLT